MKLIRRRQPRGSHPAPPNKMGGELPKLLGKEVELYLQGEPLAQDECYGGFLLYLTGTWVGFVSAYRAQIFFDHIPVTSVRKIRDVSHLKRKKKKEESFAVVNFEEPTKLADLVGEEVVVYLQGNQLLRDAGFRTRLTYVKKNWIGVTSVFNNRLLPDHIPISAIRRITKVVLRHKPGRFGYSDR